MSSLITKWMNADKMCRVSKTKSHFDRLLLARLSPTSALVSMDYKVSEMIWSFEIIFLEQRCVTCNAAWISSRVERKKKEGRKWVSSAAKNNFEGIWPCWKLRKQKKRLVWGKDCGKWDRNYPHLWKGYKWYHKSISRRPIGDKKECERRLENEIHKLGLKLAEANMVCKYILD